MDDTFADDQEVLNALAADGHDLESPMVIDFFMLASDEPAAHEMAEVLRKAGYETEIEYDEHGGHDHEDDEEVDHEHDPIWEVAVSVEMVPTAAELARLQRELQELVAPFGGEANGWGTVGNLEDEGDEGHDED
ncbi:MAG: ribonuclease E inhibitor RraB [Polyangiales bacterium]|nr:ribonuclease E inhibitor RraB [Myxococcales bacterium]MCB9662154.1 ribonuclease E inhibitor RraB [Sandaracinaceae bacterium]